MTLSGRLSAFFLVAQALVLAGFSSALYFAAVAHFDRSIEDRLDSALATLAALAEDGPGGLEWEPHDRRAMPGQDSDPDQVRWTVRDERGRVVDRSPNLAGGELPPSPTRRRGDGSGLPWRIARREVRSDDPGRPPARDRDQPRSTALTLTVALRLDPSEATLARLALALGMLSAAVWGCSALVGRRISKRALAPLTRMVADARDLGVEDPARRLPVARTGDELENLGLAFNGLLDRWHEALERQRRFAGDASHQLRTPLTAVLGQVDVALRRDRPPEEYRRVLALVRDQADHLRRIVEALLFLARAGAEADATWPDLDCFDLATWTSDQIARRADLGGGDHLRWEPPNGPASPFFVRAHPALLAQVFDNLLDNARLHGDPEAPVTLRVGREGGSVTLAVEDRGRGIAPAELPRIFEPFFRGEASGRRKPGVGLGLAVARRIAVAFGGSLEVESRSGEGSKFTLRLPEAPSTKPREKMVGGPARRAPPTAI